MTLQDIERIDSEVLTCQQVAPILKANPATIHGQAIERPELLGFPVIVAGRRVKIPKQAFLKYMKEGKEKIAMWHEVNYGLISIFECTSCGGEAPWIGDMKQRLTHFCPKCGSKMGAIKLHEDDIQDVNENIDDINEIIDTEEIK